MDQLVDRKRDDRSLERVSLGKWAAEIKQNTKKSVVPFVENKLNTHTLPFLYAWDSDFQFFFFFIVTSRKS